MNYRLTFYLLLAGFVVLSCSSNNSNTGTATKQDQTNKEVPTESGKKSPDYAIKKVELNNPLDATMVEDGKGIAELKCTSCHSLEENRLVGPGWKGITTRRKPEWIMNMITNVDMMLAEDEEAQKLLEECLVRMPNQNISVADSRSILEFMRHNDGEN
ncbi:MAG: c-type cytochrome [Bacteroidetes bacterium]|nr:c-type cytochrome [Bacteroidota bacterium]